VAGNFGVCGCFPEGRNKKLGPAMHGQKDTFRPATACADIIGGQKVILNRKRVGGVLTMMALGSDGFSKS
jgi:hypothetical protein